jgi:arylsulfatase A-like enzyme
MNAGRIVFSVFAAAGASTIVATLLKAAHLAMTPGIGRLRDFCYPRMLQEAIEAVGYSRAESLAWMTWAHDAYELSGMLLISEFVAAALIANLTVAALLALLLLLPARALTSHLPEGRRIWATALTFVAFLVPELLITVERIARGSFLRVLVATGAGALALMLVWCVTAFSLRRNDRNRSVGGAIAFAAAALACAALLFGGLAKLVAPAGRVAAGAPELVGRPNILLISIDTLRADHVRSYGYHRETTPSLDRLAAEGARFESVASPSSWTLPTHLTMLTALPPEAHGVVQSTGVRLDASVLTLPELLWSAGYTTAGFVSGGYMDALYGYSQGFDLYDDYSSSYLCTGHYRSCEAGSVLFARVRDHLAVWSDGDRERPFFIFLHMFDVHNDYLPAAPYREMFGASPEVDLTVGMLLDGIFDSGAVTDAQRDHLLAMYDGEIRSTDDWIGRILGELEDHGVLDDTIVLVTSDHGEEFAEHDHWGHHHTLYDESLLVPLIMRFPKRIPGGRVISQQVSLADLAPTLLGLAEVEAPDNFGSGGPAARIARDLTPLISGSALEWEESPAFGDLRGTLAYIRTRRWKLIRNEEDGALELYDLRADPRERENLATVQREIAAQLSSELTAWRSHWSEGGRRHHPLAQSDEHLDQLRALGYLE